MLLAAHCSAPPILARPCFDLEETKIHRNAAQAANESTNQEPEDCSNHGDEKFRTNDLSTSYAMIVAS